MRIPFLSIFIRSPFSEIQEHAEKVKECAWTFQQAVECHISDKCSNFEELRQEVVKLENEADIIKHRIRDHILKTSHICVNRFQLFRYLKEQDKILDAAGDALDWIFCRAVPKGFEKEFFLLVDAVINPIEELTAMVGAVRRYFMTYSEKQQETAKEIIHNLRNQERDADRAENIFKLKVFSIETDPLTVFHMVRLAEIIGSIADHAETAGDMMQAMITA